MAGSDFLEMGIREARRVLEHILGLKQLSQRGRARQVGCGGRPNELKMWDQAQRSASERKGIGGHLPWGQWPFPSPRPVVPRSQRPFKARCEGVSQAVGWGRPPPARVPGWGGAAGSGLPTRQVLWGAPPPRPPQPGSAGRSKRFSRVSDFSGERVRKAPSPRRTCASRKVPGVFIARADFRGAPDLELRQVPP